MRYVVMHNIHEAVDPKRELLIHDCVDGVIITTRDLLDRLPEDLEYRILSEPV